VVFEETYDTSLKPESDSDGTTGGSTGGGDNGGGNSGGGEQIPGGGNG
jgi:hypothetical protein